MHVVAYELCVINTSNSTKHGRIEKNSIVYLSAYFVFEYCNRKLSW